MSVRLIETALDKIADALWWLRGFSAAHAHEGSAQEARDMSEDLRQVRVFLQEMERAEVPFVSFGTIAVDVEQLRAILRFCQTQGCSLSAHTSLTESLHAHDRAATTLRRAVGGQLTAIF